MKFPRRKSNFLMAVLACLSVLLLAFGTVFSLPSVWEKRISADAATVEY